MRECISTLLLSSSSMLLSYLMNISFSVMLKACALSSGIHKDMILITVVVQSRPNFQFGTI